MNTDINANRPTRRRTAVKCFKSYDEPVAHAFWCLILFLCTGGLTSFEVKTTTLKSRNKFESS